MAGKMTTLAVLFAMVALSSACFKSTTTARTRSLGSSSTRMNLLGSFGGKSYYGMFTGSPIDWAAAADLCQSRGMTLASLETEEEQTSFAQLVASKVSQSDMEQLEQTRGFWRSSETEEDLFCGMVRESRNGPVFGTAPCTDLLDGAVCQA